MPDNKTIGLWSQYQSELPKKVEWPGWETVDLIGRGSFGTVYEIQRNVFGEVENAALKVITIPPNESDVEEMHNDGYDDESITATFQNYLQNIVAEYSLMRKMRGCVNIVQCEDIRYVQRNNGFGWDIFIKMELLTPLVKAVAQQIPDQIVRKIGKDICNALVACKEYGIVHRDIKPQNIFVSKYGDYKLGDFGIAKTVEKTSGGTKIGTYKYMAPEVFNNQPYGSAADIYSLGLVLYWLLNDRRMPFLPLPPAKIDVGMEESARYRRMRGEKLPPPAHGSEDLKRIVLKACAFDPKDRYASAADMLKDLNGQQPSDIEDTILIEKTPGNGVTHTNTAKKKNHLPLILGLTAGVAVAAVAVGLLFFGGKSAKPEAGWQYQSGSAYFYDHQGQAVTDCIIEIDGDRYYFDTTGVMQTGWQSIGGKLYYFAANGTMQTGWMDRQGQRYYLGDDGAAIAGRTVNLDGEIYGFDKEGVMQTGWFEDDTGKYYLDSDGKAVCGWYENHYFNQDGKMAIGQLELDGKTYLFDAEGICRIVISKQPQDKTAAMGEKVKITVEAQGEGLSYTWWASDVGDTIFYQSPTITSSTYGVKMDDVRNGRQVYCVITDLYGNTLQTQTATMKAK